MYSSCDTPKGGFPHSEIYGSKLICQLPEAYRRLSRPSSPIIAKASATCSYSLDPITLTPSGRSLTAGHEKYKFIKECLPGLSPGALCRLQIRIDSKSKFIFDAIKKLLLTARYFGSLQLTPRSQSFPLTTLIRLYELLKNSRLIDRYRSTTKKPGLSNKPLWC